MKKTSLIKTENNCVNLDQTVKDLQWDDYQLGLGINAITGEAQGNAVNQFEVTPSETKAIHQTTSLVDSSETASKQVSVAVSGKYNIGGTSLSASSQYVTEMEYSSTSVSFIVTYCNEYNEYDLPSDINTLSLTDEAKALLNESQENFNNQYGDYFVSGYKRASQFVAVYTCMSKSVTDMNKFTAEVGVASDFLSADGAIELTNSASSNNVSVSIAIYYEGVKGDTNPPIVKDAEDVLTALEWFQENEVGVKTYAYLQHYSVLDSKCSKTIQIAPEVFVDLRALYIKSFDVDSKYNTCPSAYKGNFKDAYVNLSASLEAFKNQLAENDEKRNELMASYEEMFTDLMVIFDRRDFYYNVKDDQDSEPSTSTYKHAKNKGTTWSYGYNNYDHPAVEISSESKQLKKHGKWPEHVTKDVEWKQDSSRLNVGWSVKSNKKDNGKWCKRTDPFILLNDQAKIHCKSDTSKNINYTITLNYVDGSLYKFS